MTAIQDAVKLYRQQRGMGLTAVEAAEWNGRWMWAAFGDLYGRIVPPAPDEGSRWWASIRPDTTEEKP
jgi:hypothetical protein